MILTDLGCEINATRGCTNACVACNHASTRYTEPYFMEPAVLKRDLDAMKHLLRTKLLFVQGGEPLLHPKVVELLQLCIESGIAKQAGVLTNGKLLRKMGDDLWATLRDGHCELRLSCYPDLDPEVVPWILRKADEWKFHVRPQAINGFKPLFRKNDGSTYYGCPWNRCLTIHEGWFYLCPLTAFFPKQYMGLDEHIDGIKIDGLTEPALQAFFDKDTPLETCKICAGAVGPSIPWHQNNSKAEWEAEAGMTPELVA